MKKVEVVAGIIFFHDQILCVQRPKNKYYVNEYFHHVFEVFPIMPPNVPALTVSC